jgi:hypothetical protein
MPSGKQIAPSSAPYSFWTYAPRWATDDRPIALYRKLVDEPKVAILCVGYQTKDGMSFSGQPMRENYEMDNDSTRKREASLLELLDGEKLYGRGDCPNWTSYISRFWLTIGNGKSSTWGFGYSLVGESVWAFEKLWLPMKDNPPPYAADLAVPLARQWVVDTFKQNFSTNPFTSAS